MNHNFLKFFSSFLGGVLAIGSAWSAPVSPEQAALEAAEFLNSSAAPGQTMRAPASPSALPLAFTASDAGTPLYYIFNHDNGFVIVAADTRFNSILGYSDSGSFDADRIPVNMKEWLEGYSREITHYLPILTEEIATPGWRAASYRAPIAPLLSTKWDQTTPFNLLCPTDSYGNRCVTGCVATAYAQIMRYHEWPRNPVGSSGGETFDGTIYNWRNMIDVYANGNYTSSQATAVATLMRQCGAAVNMNYSAWASGAYTFNVPVALSRYFKYAPDMKMLWKDYTPQKEWASIIYDELAAGRPVYYSGASAQGGHAFVCDGYSSNDYFHFNWGWGGYEDGYFLLSALNPASGGAGSFEGGYTSQQSIIINIRPGSESTEPSQISLISNGGFFHTSGNNYEMQDADGAMAMIYNPLGYAINIEVAIEISPSDGSGENRYVSCGSPIELQSMYGFQGFSSSSLPSLPDGEYRVKAVYRSPAVSQEWNEILIPIGMQSYVNLSVSGGATSFSNPGPDKETVSRLIFGTPEFPDHLYGGVASAVRIPVVNVGKGDFFGNLGISLTNLDDEFANAGSSFTYYSIPAETSSTIEATFYDNLKAGRYILSIMDMAGNEYADNVTVTITEASFSRPDGPITVSEIAPSFITSGVPSPLNFTVENSNLVTQKCSMRFEVLDAETSATVKRLDQRFELNVPGNFSEREVLSPFDFGLDPGEYLLRAVDDSGNPISLPYPLIVNSPILQKGGISYIVTSEKLKSAIVVAPLGDTYTGTVIIPSSIDGYKVVGLRNDAFTFSDARSVSLPESISSLAPGTFYADTNLNHLYLHSSSIIPYKEDIFAPGRESEIWLDLPDQLINEWMLAEGWNKFRTPAWYLSLDDVEIAEGMEINPATSAPYNPYRVNYDMPLELKLKAPAGKNVKVLVVHNGKWIQYETIDPVTTSILLPALGNFSSGRIELSATDDQVHVEGIAAPDAKVTVFSIDGRLVADNADPSIVKTLEPGIYIIAGKKILVK